MSSGEVVSVMSGCVGLGVMMLTLLRVAEEAAHLVPRTTRELAAARRQAAAGD